MTPGKDQNFGQKSQEPVPFVQFLPEPGLSGLELEGEIDPGREMECSKAPCVLSPPEDAQCDEEGDHQPREQGEDRDG
jgi:hypothetical protein